MPSARHAVAASPRDVVSAFASACASLVDGDGESALRNFLAVASDLMITRETWWSVGSM
jgi:thioredoxin-like negative regulator of GroEL